MIGTFPIRWDGQVHGRVTAREEGVHTVFEAECEDPGTLVRLWAFGEGRKGYLGLMEPRDGRLTLRRSMSPLSMREMPAVIAYAAPETEGSAVPKADPPAAPKAEAPAGKAQKDRSVPLRNDPPKERDTDLLWYELGDGSLYTLYGGVGYRAIPMAVHGLSRAGMVEKRTIGGREYAVYALRDGKLAME